MVYSRAERVFILEYYFASKFFATVRKTFSNAYLDKEVPNKTTIHRLVTKFRDTGSVCNRKESDCWFQHVGATAHTAKATALLQDFIDECTVGRGLWPRQSPDLTPPYFFLWGHLKE
jgi:hypothetical protein